MGVIAVNPVVDVVVGIGPEVVIGVGPVHVVEEIVRGIGPEQRPDPADDEAAAPPWSPTRAGELTVKARRRKPRLPSHVGNGAVAKYAAAEVGGAYSGPRDRAGRGGCKGDAATDHPRRRHAARRRHRATGKAAS